MLGNLIEKKSNFDLTSKSTFSNENDVFTSRSYAAFLAKNNVPSSHKKIADNYIIIKKVFKFQAVMSRISNGDKAVLQEYGLNTLEETTLQQMYNELLLLQQLANNEELKENADKILEIRVRELKYLSASRYTTVSDEIYNGYIALEHYLQEISRYPN